MTAAEVIWERPAPLTASLPMYDLPELREATDAFWSAIADRLRNRGVPAPLMLERSGESLEASWTDPQLLLSQTCGFPLMTALKDHVAIVATPVYRAPGCDGPYHRSAIIVPVGSTAETLADLHGLRCAINSPTSNTGMNLLRFEVSTLARGNAFFGATILTGSHLASVESLAEGRADVAAIDAVTLALLRRHRPSLVKNVRTLGWTVRTPGLPFITSGRRNDWMRAMLGQVLADVALEPRLQDVRDALLLTTLVSLPHAHYRSIIHLAKIAENAGYPQLC